MTSLFVSHGAPTFALEPGLAGPALTRLGQQLPRPAAVLVVSPHWMTPELRVGFAETPATIHDFNGFEPALYELEYPAPGHPAFARMALSLLEEAGWKPVADAQRGLDHGAWVPLRHLYPDASVPVFQVSLPGWLDSHSAWRLGQTLAPLRDEGVLIIGSGSLTHNLYEVRWRDKRASEYAREFSHWVREAVIAGDHERLVNALALAPHARRAHPTIEHFLPLLVALGTGDSDARGTVIEGGIEHGVLSMDSFVF
ncbi:dioxygenase family protein [Marinobacter sp. NSM]|uniref:dioxygenase family protein n=1 Tax=Marinobacter sp. NSM TaxID=3458004 RepID=UPI004035BD93